MLHCVVSTLLQFQGRGLNYDDDDSPDASTNQEQRRQLPFVLQKMANRAVAICDPGINIFKSFIIMFSLFSSFYFMHIYILKKGYFINISLFSILVFARFACLTFFVCFWFRIHPHEKVNWILNTSYFYSSLLGGGWGGYAITYAYKITKLPNKLMQDALIKKFFPKEEIMFSYIFLISACFSYQSDTFLTTAAQI